MPYPLSSEVSLTPPSFVAEQYPGRFHREDQQVRVSFDAPRHRRDDECFSKMNSQYVKRRYYKLQGFVFVLEAEDASYAGAISHHILFLPNRGISSRRAWTGATHQVTNQSIRW